MWRFPHLLVLSLSASALLFASRTPAQVVVTDPEAQLPHATTAPVEPFDYPWRTRHRSGRDPIIAFPIRTEELDYYLWFIQPSLEQSQAIDRLYLAYLDSNYELRSRDEAAVYDLGASVFSPQGLSPSQVADLNVTLIKARNRLTTRLDALDVEFFNSLVPLLNEQQQERLSRSRMLRERVVASACVCRHPGGKPDLEILVLEMARQNDDPVAFIAHAEPVLQDYSSVATVLWERFERVSVKTRLTQGRIAPILNAMAADPDPALVPRRKSLESEIIETFREMADLEIRRHDLNARFAPQIAAAMPAPASEQFLRLFRAAAYPSVYPNPFDCSDLLSSLIADPHVMDEKKIAIQGILTQFRSASEPIDARMLRRFLDFVEIFVRRSSHGSAERPAFESDMDQLQKLRRSIAQEHVLSARMIVDAELPILEPLFAAWTEHAESHQPSRTGMYYVP